MNALLGSFLCLQAWATPYAGVDLYKVPGLKGIAYQSSATGMTGITPYGIVRAYAGSSEEDAAAWMEEMLVKYERFKPEPFELLDESYATDGVLYIIRKGNIGLLSYGKAQTFQWLTALDQALVPGVYTPPPPPTLVEEADGRWRVEAPEAAHVSYSGGRRDPASHGLVFLEPPDSVIVWDGLGRHLRWPPIAPEEIEAPGQNRVAPPLSPQ